MSMEGHREFTSRYECKVPPLSKETLAKYSNPQRSTSNKEDGANVRGLDTVRAPGWQSGSNDQSNQSETSGQESNSASNAATQSTGMSSEGTGEGNGMGSEGSGQSTGMGSEGAGQGAGMGM